MNKELKENFYGRENTLSLLSRRVADLKDGYRQNIALLGNEFIGKSAILKEFIRDLGDDKVLPIYLEIENIDFCAFVNKYIGTFLFNFLKTRSLSADENQEVLIESARRFIPETVEQIKKIRQTLERNRNLDVYRDLIDLPQKLFEESGIFCVVIFDEFQNFDDFGFPFIFLELGKKIMLQRSCLYIVSSSKRSRAKKILSEKLSLLFGNFDLIDIFAFDVRVSQNFINQKLGGLISDDYKNFLIDFTGGYPFYLDVICQELKKFPLQIFERSISLDSLAVTLEKLLFEKKGFFYQHFRLLMEQIGTGGFKKGLTSTLFVLANGYNKLKDISPRISKERGSVLLKLSRLVELNVVSKNGNFYYICDRLFSFWLKEVYQKEINSFNYDEESSKSSFRGALKKIIESFCQIAKKDLSNRVIELFNSFDDEYFQFNGKKYRLPVFEEIKPLKIERQNKSSLEAIIARNPEVSWLVLLREDVVNEEEVILFIEKISKFDLKPEKKILIFINEIEPNARLKALQEKMLLWNVSDLNLLMNFYHRPYFIK